MVVMPMWGRGEFVWSCGTYGNALCSVQNGILSGVTACERRLGNSMLWDYAWQYRMPLGHGTV